MTVYNVESALVRDLEARFMRMRIDAYSPTPSDTLEFLVEKRKDFDGYVDARQLVINAYGALFLRRSARIYDSKTEEETEARITVEKGIVTMLEFPLGWLEHLPVAGRNYEEYDLVPVEEVKITR